METNICRTCGCSLVRLGISADQAAARQHGGEQHLFCCEGCADLFVTDPARYLRETGDWIVCPTCLAEKPMASAVRVSIAGKEVRFCRCPYCVEMFEQDPDFYTQRLRGAIPSEACSTMKDAASNRLPANRRPSGPERRNPGPLSMRTCLLAVLAGVILPSCAAVEGRGRAYAETARAGDDPRLAQLGLLYDDTIVTESGRTVDFNGQAVVPRYIHVEKSGSGADLAVDVAVINVVFGLNKDFTLKLGIPYVNKRLDRPGSAPTLRSEGLGDVPLVGKYRFYQKTGLGETTEAAAIFGFELPTGRDGVSAGGMLLPAPLQPGSGSLDAILGGAVTRVDGRWLVNADLIAKINSEANDYRFGNALRADVGGQYRVHPARYERFDQLTVNLLAELNSVWLGRDRMAGAPVQASGGFKLFATPGIQVIFNRYFLLEAAVQIPVVMDLHGGQLEEDYVAIIGLRARF